VLALTEFLRKSKVVGAYLEFFGEGAAKLSIGDRATISNMAPEYGATAAMFSIDEQTLTTCALTGRAAARWSWSKPTPRKPGCGPTPCKAGVRALAGVRPLDRGAQHGRPLQSARAAWPVPTWRAKGIAGPWTRPAAEEGTLPDGAVVIAAITSCTNTSNPRNVIAAGLLARNARRLGLNRASRGSKHPWHPVPRPSSCT
jgi:aconitase A